MPRKSLFYVPGLISLVCLPVVLAILPPEDPKEYVCMKLNLPTDKTDDELRFTEAGFLKSLKDKKIISARLIHDHHFTDDEQPAYLDRFPSAIPEIASLQKARDTCVVLKYTLGRNNTYGDFVWLCNAMKLSDCKRFVYLHNDFYVLSNFPSSIEIPDTSFRYEPLDPIPQDLSWHPPTKWDIFLRDLRYESRWSWYLVRHSWIYCLGFLLLIIIPFAVRIRKI